MRRRSVRIFYVSTNEVWGGSEELWLKSLTSFLHEGHKLALAVKYENKRIDEIKGRLTIFINFHRRFNKLSTLKRIVNKVVSIFRIHDVLLKALQQFKPDLVILSQGNNISSLDIMELCVLHSFRFVTVSQLVTSLNWFWVDGDLRSKLVKNYQKAVKNYFVSKNNLNLHEFLLAYTSFNSELVYNPFSIEMHANVHYPHTSEGFDAAIVGRIECYHKGLDLLIQALSDVRWKKRPMRFNFYGNGPHISIIKDLVVKLDISSVFFYGHTSVIEIWKKNHILIQPSRMEGQSLALLEALNLNRTAVITNVGGACEVVTDNITGFIANNPTVEEIDNVLERAWERRLEWEDFGIRAGNKMRSVMPENPVAFFNNKIMKIIGDPSTNPPINHSFN